MANPRMTAEIGRVLGGRYRLVAPIGMGASAQVYLADDVKLRRRVALKMLHDALAGDAEFLRRFRAEARAAAALSHPNVMAVYDWSDGTDEGEVAFIVTEYLPGGSLRALLDSGAQLSPSQALGVGLEAARALDYAHRRGFVHRDIKPANLLFGEEQRLRIADFGLARALAEAAWTEPQGAMLGTARYASPEQAKGEHLSGKADVYSLALVLVEAVTGEVPFVADTTLGTLMARVDKPLVVSDELGPLQEIVAQAGHPDPEQRIDARTLAKGLLRAASQLSRPAPLPLVGALASGAAVGPDPDPTVHAPGPLPGAADAASDLTADDLELEPPHWVNQAEPPLVGGFVDDTAIDPEPEPEVVAVVAPAVAALYDAEFDEPDLAPPDVDAGAESEPDAAADADPAGRELDGGDPGPVVVPAIVAPVVAPDPDVDLDPDPTTDQVDAVAALPPDGDGTGGSGSAPPERRRRRWPWVLLVLALVAGAAGAAAAVAASRDDGPTAAPVVLPVPKLAGRTEAQATTIARAAGWKVRTVRERRDGSTKGEVLETAPPAGTRLPDGRTLTLTVSDGQTIVDVPTDLAGKTVEAATAELEGSGLVAKVADMPYSEDVAKGSVIALADGTPGRLEKGSTVSLVASNGPEPRVIPGGLVGSTEAAAKDALTSLRLVPAIVRSYSDSVREGQVISVLPKSGTTVPRGSTVNVEVSRGPELVAVPSIRSASSISEAVAILRRAGLKAGNVTGPAAGSPTGTSPGAGTMVKKGSTVNIILG